MRKKMKRSSLQIVLGISFAGISILTACSTRETPGPTLSGEIQETKLQEESPTLVPKDIATATTKATEEGSAYLTSGQGGEDTTLERGYPASEEQQVNPDNQTDGYPAPDQLPTPVDQTGGYPSPAEDYPPPVKTELQATIPSTVNLASGELQLVEFFAFW